MTGAITKVVRCIIANEKDSQLRNGAKRRSGKIHGSFLDFPDAGNSRRVVALFSGSLKGAMA